MNEVIITCEHYGNAIPQEYAALFVGQEELLATHRGYDLGVDVLWQTFSPLADFCTHYANTRLLVDLNRPESSPTLFSNISHKLTKSQKEQVLQMYHRPYWQAVQQAVQQSIKQKKKVIHLSLHTFTPFYNGKVRRTDVGILYDPHTSTEASFAKKWRKNIQQHHPTLAVHCNLPYRGTTPSLTTTLRKIFPSAYVGLELEVNQKYIHEMHQIADLLKESFLCTISNKCMSADQCFNSTIDPQYPG